MSPFFNDKKIDSTIRFFLYILIFWLPYSPAVVETCVIIALILWLTKRSMLAWQLSGDPAPSNNPFLRYIQSYKPVPSALNAPIALFLAICLISVLNCVFVGQSFRNFLTKTLEWFIVYFLVIEVFKDRKSLLVLVYVFIITAVATGIDSLIQFYITHKDIFLGHTILPGARPTAGFKTPNGLGAYLTIIVPSLLAFVFLKGKRFRVRGLLVAALILMAWSLILTFSRGAWIGVLFGFIFLMVVSLFSKDKMKLYLSLGLLFVTVFLYVAFLLILANSSSSDLLTRYDTVNWRLDIWQDSMAMIRDRPLFGHGINTFMLIYESYRSSGEASPTYAHNCYIQMVVETGIIGLMSFLWILIKMFQNTLDDIGRKMESNKDVALVSIGLCAGILAFLIHSFFDTNFYSLQLSVYLWFMIGILMSLNKLIEGKVHV